MGHAPVGVWPLPQWFSFRCDTLIGHSKTSYISDRRVNRFGYKLSLIDLVANGLWSIFGYICYHSASLLARARPNSRSHGQAYSFCCPLSLLKYSLVFFINPLEMKCARHMTFCAFASKGVCVRARARACVRTCTRVVEVMLGPGGGVVFSHEYSWGPPP